MEDNSDHVEQQTSSADYISCRYCLEVEGYLTEPKQLPCSHIYCLPCLSSDLMTNDIIRCPTCRYVTDISLDKLPTAVRGDNKLLCDVCVRDEVYDENSKVYCTECAIKFCHKHELMHEELHRSHDDKMIGIADYRLRARQLEVRKCIEHKEKTYGIACNACHQAFCSQCVNFNSECSKSKGQSHNYLPLNELAEVLKSRLDPVREEMRVKESKVSELVKSTEIVLSVWDSETEEMILLIRKTRDEQIASIKAKYDKIEQNILSCRTKTKDDITKYLDEEAGVKMAELKKEILKFDAKLRDLHQVDYVTHHSRLMTQITELSDEDFPSLALHDQYRLSEPEEKRETEINWVSTEDYVISLDIPLPTQLKLIKEIEVTGECITVCQQGGVTYVGMNDGNVVTVDCEGKVKPFIKLNGPISSVRVYKGRLYTLMYAKPYIVYVHELSGTVVTSWEHTDSNKYYHGNKLSFSNDQLVISDANHHKLVTYNLKGKVVLERHCPHLRQENNSDVFICSADSSSIIVSHLDRHEVFRISMETGAEEWMSKGEIKSPQGVGRYGERYLMVSNRESEKTTVWILDISTGEKLREISESSKRTQRLTYDLYVEGNTIIIPRYREKKVLFYKLI